MAAAFFRFLRQPSRPNAPRPEAKSGRAAGSGVAPGAGAPLPNPSEKKMLYAPEFGSSIVKLGSIKANIESVPVPETVSDKPTCKRTL